MVAGICPGRPDAGISPGSLFAWSSADRTGRNLHESSVLDRIRADRVGQSRPHGRLARPQL